MLGPEALSPAVMTILLEFSPFPQTVVEKLKQAISQQSQQPDPKQAESQAKVQESAARIKEIDARTQEHATNAQLKAVELRVRAAELQSGVTTDQTLKGAELMLRAKEHDDNVAIKAADSKTKRAAVVAGSEIANKEADTHRGKAVVDAHLERAGMALDHLHQQLKDAHAAVANESKEQTARDAGHADAMKALAGALEKFAAPRSKKVERDKTGRIIGVTESLGK
jgi:hypothetical protein